MDIEQIKTQIKNDVFDQDIDDDELLAWIQEADNEIQTWKPINGQAQTFDYWDYLKDLKHYCTVAGINKVNCRTTLGPLSN